MGRNGGEMHLASCSSPQREVAMSWFRKIIVGAATGAALLAFSFNPGYSQVGPRGATTPSAETSRQLEVLGKVLEIVRSDYVDKPAPDPAMFGLPTEDDGSRNDPLLAQNMVSCTHYQPDFDALRAASTRIVLAAGTESGGEMAHRGAEAVAERLGTTPVAFPSGHGGFLGGEYGQRGEPDAFAATLREVLTAKT